MLLMNKPGKSLATLIVEGKGSSSDKKEDPYTLSKDGVDQDSEAGLDSASEALLSAIESKDAKALKQAFKDLVTLCSDEEEYKESASEDASA